jgi:extracellular factor (EF) 3-hydroxypalmitic acid methyl ester biosynthesis protein
MGSSRSACSGRNVLKLRRDPRYIPDPKEPEKVVRFHDFQDIERTCQVRDFSRTGMSFLLEDGSLIFRIGDVISDIHFFSYNKEVHSCGATIIHILDEYQGDKVVSRIGCRFENAMDISTIIYGDKVTRLKNEYSDFIHTLAVEDNLNQEFVHLASHLHYLLTNFRNKIREEDARIQDEEDPLRSTLFETLRTLTFEAIREVNARFCDQFTTITSQFTDSKQHYIHREYFQRMLNEFFATSALFDRAWTKPLGYAGDYEMMNIIYRNDFEGRDIFSQVLNKVDCESSAARAVRNRRDYFFRKISQVCQTVPEGEACKIVSVACGPCVEMADYLEAAAGTKRPVKTELIAMDQDANAIQDAQQRLIPLADPLSGITVHVIRNNIKELIIGRKKDNELYADADLIYTAGLCDYLSLNATNRLVNELYRYLKPGGTLIVGNFGTYNPQRFKMEYGSEWFLIHRSEEEIKDFAKGLPEDISLSVEKEPEGVNLFLNVTKPA